MIELKIELMGISPSIWRRIAVPNNITLDVLHFAIQGSMPWQNCHLHEFEIDGHRYELRELEDDSWDRDDDRKDETRGFLDKLVKKGDTFTYTYDFGNGWHHLLTVEKISKGSEDFPACVGGERACPPEDCGGPYFYDDFLKALTNKKNPEHRETKKWAGHFQPEIFSIQQADAAVGAMFVWANERRQRNPR